MRLNTESLSLGSQPPMAVPLRHFLVGLPFLVIGGLVALADAAGVAGPLERIASTHLLLVGWVCLTILGAMTQFVPVWSGVELHSKQLARVQLVLVAVGVAGFASLYGAGRFVWAIPFALTIVAGFVVFVYNLVRTLLIARPWDETERHFLLALGFFAVAATLGGSLALALHFDVYPLGPVTRPSVIGAHFTLAVFGGVIVTVAGALYQLGPMFTQCQPTSIDARLRQVETVTLPGGVLLLAGGRLAGHAPTATAGGLLVAVGVLATGLFLARRLYGATVDYSPMLPRYAVVALAAIGWAATSATVWIDDPLSARFGVPGIGTYLLFAFVGFVVLGTLYHVVPFIIWVHRYSDLIGLEPVPAIDDLYSGRIETADLALTVVGSVLVIGGAAASGFNALASAGVVLGGVLVVAGVTLFAANMVFTVLVHAPDVAGLPGTLSEYLDADTS